MKIGADIERNRVFAREIAPLIEKVAEGIVPSPPEAFLLANNSRSIGETQARIVESMRAQFNAPEPPEANRDLAVLASAFVDRDDGCAMLAEWIDRREVVLHYLPGVAIKVDRRSLVGAAAITLRWDEQDVRVYPVEAPDIGALIPRVSQMVRLIDGLPIDAEVPAVLEAAAALF